MITCPRCHKQFNWLSNELCARCRVALKQMEMYRKVYPYKMSVTPNKRPSKDAPVRVNNYDVRAIGDKARELD